VASYGGLSAFIKAGKAKAKGSPHGHFWESEPRYRLTIITSPSVESIMAGPAVGRSRDAVREPASLRPQIPEPVLYNWQQVLKSADESLDSNEGNMRLMMARERGVIRGRRVRRVRRMS